MDISSCVGKEVVWTSPSCDGPVNGIIVGADSAVGYTIVNADDPEEFLTCANFKLESWDQLQSYLIKAAKTGKYDVGEVDALLGIEQLTITLMSLILGIDDNPTEGDCPFS